MNTEDYQMLAEARARAESYCGTLHNLLNALRTTGQDASTVAYLYNASQTQVRTLDDMLQRVSRVAHAA